MPDAALLVLTDVHDGEVATAQDEQTPIMGLAAAAGMKSRLRQRAPAVSAPDHLGVERLPVGIVQVESGGHAGLTQPPCTGWCEQMNSRNAGRPLAFSSKARRSAGMISAGWVTSSP